MLTTELQKHTQALTEVDGVVDEYLSSTVKSPMQRAFLTAIAVQKLSEFLTPSILNPITKLQGSRLGFRTDKDHGESRYDVNTVRQCFIESLLAGVKPVGNQWNIIAGNCYITKEGCTYLLSQIKGLTYKVVPGIPKVSQNSSGEIGAVVEVDVSWGFGDKIESEKLSFVCKGAKDRNGKSVTGADAYMGKAERKAKHWLYHHITGNNLAEGDATEVEPIDVTAKDVSGPRLRSVHKSPVNTGEFDQQKGNKICDEIYAEQQMVENPPKPGAPPQPTLTDLDRFLALRKRIGDPHVDQYVYKNLKYTLTSPKTTLEPKAHKFILDALKDTEEFAKQVARAAKP